MLENVTFTVEKKIINTSFNAEQKLLTVNIIESTGDGGTSQTPQQIVSSIDSLIGIDWKTQRTVEFIQDVVGAMLQAGTHTNITVQYDDVNGGINLTGNAGGSGTTLTEEEVEDIVGGLATQGTGINVSYDDANNALVVSLTGESFTNAHKNKLDGIEAQANKYVHPATHQPSIISQNSTNRFVTDTEKATWNGKVSESQVKGTSRKYTKQQNFDQATLADAATLNWNLDSAQTSKLTFTSGVGNTRTLPNSILTNAVNGGNYQLTVFQDSVGGRTIVFDETVFNVQGSWNLEPNARTVISIVPQDGKADVVLNGSQEIKDFDIYKSPNGSKWKLSVDDTGNLNIEPL